MHVCTYTNTRRRLSIVCSTHIGRDVKFPLAMLEVNRLIRFVVYAQSWIPHFFAHVAVWGTDADGVYVCGEHGQLALPTARTYAHAHTGLRCICPVRQSQKGPSGERRTA